MSIMRCEKHDRLWDSDFLDECPECEAEVVSFDTRLRRGACAILYITFLAIAGLGLGFASWVYLGAV